MAVASSRRDTDAPGGADAGRAGLIPALKRSFASFRAHEMTDHAGTLTYLAMMSLFPALLLGVKIGLGSTARNIWAIARWPAALVVAMVAYGLVYAVAPNIVPQRFRWISTAPRSA